MSSGGGDILKKTGKNLGKLGTASLELIKGGGSTRDPDSPRTASDFRPQETSLTNKQQEGIAKNIARKRSIAEAANEQARLDFNRDIFSVAESLAGSIAQKQNLNFDFDSLSLIGGDPRADKLKTLVSSFKRRASEVKGGQISPGLKQTRLSILE